MSIIYAGCISVIVLALLGVWATTEEIIKELTTAITDASRLSRSSGFERLGPVSSSGIERHATNALPFTPNFDQRRRCVQRKAASALS